MFAHQLVSYMLEIFFFQFQSDIIHSTSYIQIRVMFYGCLIWKYNNLDPFRFSSDKVYRSIKKVVCATNGEVGRLAPPVVFLLKSYTLRCFSDLWSGDNSCVRKWAFVACRVRLNCLLCPPWKFLKISRAPLI